MYTVFTNCDNLLCIGYSTTNYYLKITCVDISQWRPLERLWRNDVLSFLILNSACVYLYVCISPAKLYLLPVIWLVYFSNMLAYTHHRKEFNFLNQTHAGQRPVFIEIAFICDVCMSVCVSAPEAINN